MTAFAGGAIGRVTMNELVDLLEAATESFGVLIGAVESDQWLLPTPCPQFVGHDVVNHVVESLTQYTELVENAHFDLSLTVDITGSEFGVIHRSAARRAILTWSRNGVLEAEHPMPWGPVPGRDLVGHLVLEHVVHGWDVATATGHHAPYCEELVAAAGRIAGGYPEEVLRQAGMFAAAVDAADGATALDRLAAFLGRRKPAAD